MKYVFLNGSRVEVFYRGNEKEWYPCWIESFDKNTLTYNVKWGDYGYDDKEGHPISDIRPINIKIPKDSTQFGNTWIFGILLIARNRNFDEKPLILTAKDDDIWSASNDEIDVDICEKDVYLYRTLDSPHSYFESFFERIKISKGKISQKIFNCLIKIWEAWIFEDFTHIPSYLKIKYLIIENFPSCFNFNEIKKFRNILKKNIIKKELHKKFEYCMLQKQKFKNQIINYNFSSSKYFSLNIKKNDNKINKLLILKYRKYKSVRFQSISINEANIFLGKYLKKKRKNSSIINCNCRLFFL